ncbi:MAG: PcfJ domain-containing protein [Patescibacteria group bacterium]
MEDLEKQVLNANISINVDSQEVLVPNQSDIPDRVISKTDQALESLSKEKRDILLSSESELILKLSEQQGLALDEEKKYMLKLKLARYLQTHNSVDVNVLFDALIESPKFLENEKGGFHRLLEIHEQKTLQKIAEMRRKKAEQTGDESLNPYEALFQTDSGKYYLARLLNMPHLEEESEYLKHCVGTSDSYISKMKRGDAEILSIRSTSDHKPILTIEYFPKTREINQIKGKSDEYLTGKEEYFADVLEILKKMKTTETDTGEKRDFTKINPSELNNFKVKPYHVLTDQGEMSLRDYNPDSGMFVLKVGNMDITKDMPKEECGKIIQLVLSLKFESKQIAYSVEEVNEETKIYLGDWNTEIFKKIRQYPAITHLYASVSGINSLDKKIFHQTIETDPSIQSPEDAEKKLKEKSIILHDYGKCILQKTEFSQTKVSYGLVSFTARELGVGSMARIGEIYEKAIESGLELCPSEVGPNLRLSYIGRESMSMAMEQMSGFGDVPYVWDLRSGSEGLELNAREVHSIQRKDYQGRFVFLYRKN